MLNHHNNMINKKNICFVGAGIVSLVSVIDFIEKISEAGQFSNYNIYIIEKSSNVASGISFANGGNITAIEGLGSIRPNKNFFSKLSPNLEDSWFINADNYTNDHEEFYNNAKILAKLGNYSIEKYLKFFAQHPYIEKQSKFIYCNNNSFLRFYNDKNKFNDDIKFFNQINFPPITQHLNINLNSEYNKAIATIGGSLDACAFSLALANLLKEKYQVNFMFNCQIKAFEYKNNLLENIVIIDNLKQSTTKLKVDHLVISTGCNFDLLNKLNINLAIKPLAGCTITVEIPNNSCDKNKFAKPFKLVTNDGLIVFSPFLSENKLRIGGLYWYDKDADCSTSSKLATQGLLKLKNYLKSISFTTYQHATINNSWQEWVGFRPFMIDNMPIIDHLPNYNNIWLNIGHGSAGTSYAFACADILNSQIINYSKHNNFNIINSNKLKIRF